MKTTFYDIEKHGRFVANGTYFFKISDNGAINIATGYKYAFSFWEICRPVEGNLLVKKDD